MTNPTNPGGPIELTPDMQVAAGVVPARILARFGAIFIDGLIVTFAAVALQMATGIASSGVTALLILIYETAMIGAGGQTLGKKLLKVKVILNDGGEIGYGRALLRAIGTRISTVLLCLGYVVAFFTENKRALHDYIAGTRVIEA